MESSSPAKSLFDRILGEGQKLKRNVLTKVEPQEHPGPIPVGPPKRPKMIRITGGPKKPTIVQVSGPPLAPPKPKKPKKPTPSERLALVSDRSLYGRVFTESKKSEDKGEKPPFGSRFAKSVERVGAKIEKHFDLYRTDHPLHPIVKWAEKRAGKETSGDTKRPEVWSPQKHGGGAVPAAQSAENVRRQVQFDTAMKRSQDLQRAADVSRRAQAGRLQPSMSQQATKRS